MFSSVCMILKIARMIFKIVNTMGETGAGDFILPRYLALFFDNSNGPWAWPKSNLLGIIRYAYTIRGPTLFIEADASIF